MNCPNCNHPDMRTIETFKLTDVTYRTKKCRACSWTFTTIEALAETQVIPNAIRNVKRKAIRVPQPPTQA